jgi:AcrR family transcriptional regulator
MATSGFDGATIEAIARRARVSTQTVYAIFGSKKGIVAELLERASFGPAYLDAVKKAKETNDPAERLRGAAGIARQVYDSERAELELLRGAAAVSPELAGVERAREIARYEHQARLIESLVASGRLRPGVDAATARDILWTLTGRETFRMLVNERRWSPARYQSWLGDLLVSALLTGSEPTRPVQRAKRQHRG